MHRVSTLCEKSIGTIDPHIQHGLLVLSGESDRGRWFRGFCLAFF